MPDLEPAGHAPAAGPKSAADLAFYFDPVCPFCWMTSKWVRMVAAQREYRVDWRFISLRLVNAHIDYAAHFPPEYEAGHTAGLRLLRVAARTRAEHGPDAVGRLYLALGTGSSTPSSSRTPRTSTARGDAGVRGPVLAEAGLPAELADALDDPAWDAAVQAETDEALALTGKDVGTPILQFGPPDGPAFFGPVISRLPARGRGRGAVGPRRRPRPFPGFAELKRSLRELPQLRALGVAESEVGSCRTGTAAAGG